MKYISKPMPLEGDLPFSFIYKKQKDREDELPDHLHDWCELIYIHAGEATFFIDQQVLEIKKGDLIFVPPNIIHKTMIQSNHCLTTSVLYFLPDYFIKKEIFPYILSDVFYQSKRSQKYLYSLNGNKRINLDSYFKAMDIEKQNKRKFWEESCFSLLIRLMVQLHRWKEEMIETLEKPSQNIPWLNTVIEYVDNHLDEPLHLEDISSRVYMSTANLSKHFKSTVGINISHFIMQKRILKSKELLRETNKSVEEIAELSGYNSMPYFHRTFKKFVGDTPAKYRKKNKYNFL